MRMLVPLVLAAALGGCTQTAGYMSLAAVSKFPGVPRPIARGVTGQDCEYSVAPDLGLAIARALNRAGHGANALVDVDVDVSRQDYIFWARACIRVRGDAVHIDRIDAP